MLVACLYLPNGNPQPGPKFDYKLAWFERLIAHAASLLDAGVPVVLAGDYNVVPTDADIYAMRLVPRQRAAAAGAARRLPAPARAGLARRDPRALSGPAGLHVLGLLPQRLAARRRPAHRPPAASRRASPSASPTPASTARCAAARSRATTRRPGWCCADGLAARNAAAGGRALAESAAAAAPDSGDGSADALLATAPAPAEPSVGRAAAWMAGWLTAMLVMLVAGREATRELHVFQILEVRSLLGLVLLVPLIVGAGGWRVLRTARLPQHVGRNVVHYAAQFALVRRADADPDRAGGGDRVHDADLDRAARGVFLGERLTGWKIAAVVLGMVGCAVIVRPHVDSVEPGQLIALACALGFAVSVILVKSLTRTEHAVTIMFWMLVVQSLLGVIPAALTWRTPSVQVWPWLVVIAICGTFSHYCMARALRHADATVVVPMDFLRVPLSVAAGWLVYAERLDALSFAGGVLILAANALNLVRRRSTGAAPSAASTVSLRGRERDRRRACKGAKASLRPGAWAAESGARVGPARGCGQGARRSPGWPPGQASQRRLRPLAGPTLGPGRFAAPSFVAGSLCGPPHGLADASSGAATRPGAGPALCRPGS